MKPRYATLTQNCKYDADTNHDNVEEIPKVSQVEDASIAPFLNLIPQEGYEPDIEDNLHDGNFCEAPFQHNTIIKDEEGDEEGNFPGLQILGDPKARVEVSTLPIIIPRLLGRIYRDRVPEYNVAMPQTGDDLLDDMLAEEPLRVRDDGNLEGVETLQRPSPARDAGAGILSGSDRAEGELGYELLNLIEPRATAETVADSERTR